MNRHSGLSKNNISMLLKNRGRKVMVIIMNAEKINKLKNDIINYIIPLLDDLRNENKKGS